MSDVQYAIEASFKHLIFSPHGGVEGVLLESADGPLQLVFERHDEASPLAFDAVREGQTVVVDAAPQGPSDKGEGAHPVYLHRRLRSVDGRKPAKPKAAAGAAYQGTVVRFNYARHGAPNGVVLDTGDFIHTRPDGLARLKLKIGDVVRADGDAQLLASGTGWAVEAVSVNGRKIKPH
jgi:hypothetical protein